MNNMNMYKNYRYLNNLLTRKIMTCIKMVNKSSETFLKKVCLQISFKNIKAFSFA